MSPCSPMSYSTSPIRTARSLLLFYKPSTGLERRSSNKLERFIELALGRTSRFDQLRSGPVKLAKRRLKKLQPSLKLRHRKQLSRVNDNWRRKPRRKRSMLSLLPQVRILPISSSFKISFKLSRMVPCPSCQVSFTFARFSSSCN